MAITIASAPQLYTPSKSPSIFNLKSSDPDYFVYFLVNVLSSDGAVIGTFKYSALPNFKDGSVFDLSSILQNYVDYQIVNSTNIIEPVGDIILSYKLQVTEYLLETVFHNGDFPYYETTGNVISSGTLTTDIYNVFQGELSRIQILTYNFNDYVITTTSTTKFLTSKPLVNNIYRDSTEYLYLLNNISTTGNTVNFKFYGVGNVLLGSQNIPMNTGKALRVNISPTALSAYFGTGFNNVYGDQFQSMFTVPFGEYSDLLSANYYTVQVVTANGTPRSEIRSFIMMDSKCKTKSFQALFSNPLGGFDTLTLFNPRESINSNKTSITNYPYALNASGQYSNISNGVYNDTSTVINTNNVSTYKAITDVLNDEQAQWLRNIITAEKVYVVLADNTFLPVSLSTTSYNIVSRRINTNNNRLELEFTSDVAGLFSM